MSLTQAQKELHWDRVTASQVATILGENPFETPGELLRRKVLKLVTATTDAMERGHLLEPVIAKWAIDKALGGIGKAISITKWATDTASLEAPHFGITNKYKAEFKYDRVDDTVLFEDWGGATPDFLVVDDDDNVVAALECKSSASDFGWGYGSVPKHIWYQVQWQMYVLRHACGIEFDCMYVPALLKSNFEYRIVHYDEPAVLEFIPKLKQFQAMVFRYRETGLPESDPCARINELSPFELDGDDFETPTMLDDLIEAKRQKSAADKVYKEVSGVLLDRLSGSSGIQYGDKRVSVCGGAGKVTEKLDYKELARDLARLLIRDGKRREVETLHKIHTKTYTRKPYLMVRDAKTKKEESV